MDLLRLSIVFILVSCAVTPERKEIRSENKNLKATSITEKKKRIEKLLSEHPEFEQDKKEKIGNIMLGALERNEELKKKESKLIQQVTNYTLVKPGSYDDLVALRRELKRVYMDKYDNTDKMIKALKDVLGITPKNGGAVDLVNDFQVELNH